MVEIRMTHRWTHLLKQQSSITVSLLPTKEDNVCFPFPFEANKLKGAVSGSPFAANKRK
jgi:hypothetical protein